MVIAHVVNASFKPLIVAYEAGAMMPTVVAPDRRVAFLVETKVLESLLPAGWRLFDASVTWALGRP